METNMKHDKSEEAEAMFCQKCGDQLEEGSVFCMNCGAKVVQAGAESEAKSMLLSEGPKVLTPVTGSEIAVNKRMIVLILKAIVTAAACVVCMMSQEIIYLGAPSRAQQLVVWLPWIRWLRHLYVTTIFTALIYQMFMMDFVMILNVLQLVIKKKVISVGAIIVILFISLSLWMAFAKKAFLWLAVLGAVELVLTIAENASKQKA